MNVCILLPFHIERFWNSFSWMFWGDAAVADSVNHF